MDWEKKASGKKWEDFKNWYVQTLVGVNEDWIERIKKAENLVVLAEEIGWPNTTTALDKYFEET